MAVSAASPPTGESWLPQPVTFGELAPGRPEGGVEFLVDLPDSMLGVACGEVTVVVNTTDAAVWLRRG